MDMFKKVIALILTATCVYLIIIGTWAVFIKDKSSNPLNVNANIRDSGGSSYIKTESTPDGDLWIYNSSDKTIQFVENPKKTGEIKVVTKSSGN